MGNSVVVKPAEQASYSMLKVAELALEAGIPPGVCNVLTGDGATGKSLALHHQVQGIYFTGSSATGKKILQYAGRSNMKKVGLECGGKSPFILTRHCGDLQRAAEVLAANIFYNQGQICSASSRLIVDKNVKKAFLPLLLKQTRSYMPGDPLDFTSRVGHLVSMTQFERVRSFIEAGRQAGSRC